MRQVMTSRHFETIISTSPFSLHIIISDKHRSKPLPRTLAITFENTKFTTKGLIRSKRRGFTSILQIVYKSISIYSFLVFWSPPTPPTQIVKICIIREQSVFKVIMMNNNYDIGRIHMNEKPGSH
jgi:hypothetical protein